MGLPLGWFRGHKIIESAFRETVNERHDGVADPHKTATGFSVGHIVKSTPAPTTPAPNATPTASKVIINGTATAFEAYTIGGNNYFKLRDLAAVVSGTEKQFEVGYDNATKAITLTSGTPYTVVGGELSAGDGKAKTATPSASKIYLDGKELNLTIYTINGNNFFKLRDLMKAIDVYVGYDNATKNITLDTSKSYTD